MREFDLNLKLSIVMHNLKGGQRREDEVSGKMRIKRNTDRIGRGEGKLGFYTPLKYSTTIRSCAI